eukprot:Skav203488  [mRNA]  locus=scaffold3956:65827:66033:+ [translate_table: standard]
MEGLEKMIHEELPKLLKLTTEEAAAAEAASMTQLGTGASPFVPRPMVAAGCHGTMVERWAMAMAAYGY